MSRNGSGTYTKVNTFSSGASITASGHNANWDDIALEMTNSLALDGQSVMTGQVKAANGTASAPGYTFGADLNTGFYRIGADELGAAVGGTKILDISSTGLVVTGTLSASGGLDANAVITASITDAAVTTAKIADANVTSAKLAANAVVTAGITDANVTTAKIASANITTALIADSAVTTAKINDGAVTAAKLSASGSLYVTETQSANTATSCANTSGAWTVAVLNTTNSNTITSASRTNNVISLPAGTYRVIANLPFGSNGGTARLRLYNTTDSATALINGSNSANSGNASGTTTWCMCNGVFVIAGTKSFQFEFYCSSKTSATPNDGDSNIYLNAIVEKIA